ncbi:MAG TPA: ferritin-like domain-containing protein [Terriglobia bacterium]|nr:ferritin-like domain-containing protein [Terriglobia bacterium]
MKVNSLREVFIDELKDIYDAEQQIVKALPQMVKAASAPELGQVFEAHLQETKGHVRRIEQIFQGMSQDAKAKKCDGVRGILKEGEDAIDLEGDANARDAALIAAAQRVEHYEMAVYGSLKNWASQIGEERAAGLLGETLNEEKAADQKLNHIAMSGVNSGAARAASA